PAGEGYKEQLRQLIIGSDALLFLVSPHSVVSPACAVELRIAHEQNKRLLPVVYKPVDDPAVPEPLRDPQWISIDDGAGFSAAVGSLVQAINTNFEFLPEFRRLAVAAEIWSKSERGRDDLLRGDALKRARRW